MPLIQNFSMPAGNTASIGFIISPTDEILSGADVWWMAYGQSQGIPDGNPALIVKKISNGGIELSSSPFAFTVFLDEADTIALLGAYFYEATVLDALGGAVTITQGLMTITIAQNPGT